MRHKNILTVLFLFGVFEICYSQTNDISEDNKNKHVRHVLLANKTFTTLETASIKENCKKIIQTKKQSDLKLHTLLDNFDMFSLPVFLNKFLMEQFVENQLNISSECFEKWSRLRDNFIKSRSAPLLDYPKFWSRRGKLNRLCFLWYQRLTLFKKYDFRYNLSIG